jgi:polysaccharide export outer membrane protein
MLSRRWTSLLVAGLAAAATVALIAPSMVRAQNQSATEGELDMLHNLSPDQQQEAMEALTGRGGGLGGNLGGGLGGGALGGATSGLGGANSQQRQEQQEFLLQQRRNEQDREHRLEQEDPDYEPLIPRFKGDDSIIVEVDFHLQPRPVLARALIAQGINPQTGLPVSASGGQPQDQMQLDELGQGVTSGTTLDTEEAPPAQGLPGAGLAAQAAAANNAGIASDQRRKTALLTEDERADLQKLIDLIRSKNPYKLNHDGVLFLPGFFGIPLGGLTEDQASLRLQSEPTFQKVQIRVTRLPLKKFGAEGLKHFGYDLFDRPFVNYSPVTSVPVPADYIVGPGDELEVQLYGSQNRTLNLVVGRDGRVNFPELGPINVGGQLFTAMKSSIESKVEHQMIGVHASVSVGVTKLIRVFVLGEARHPGSYIISGLGTITSALYASGGVKPTGSLRNIVLKRQGALVRKLDLYDMLIRGDSTDDAKLLPGDVVFIPSVGPTSSVDGEVYRPAIYEIKGDTSIAALVELAGGLTPEADTNKASLTRIDAELHRIVLPVALSGPGASAEHARNGDLLRVAKLGPTIDSGVVVQGHVYSPASYAWRRGLRLSDVIRSLDDLQPDADLHYVLVRRLFANRKIAVISADLAAALATPGSKADIELQPRDRITVFDLGSGRERIVKPILDELKLQASVDEPTEIVHIDGRTKAPGDYPLEPGMRIRDLIRAGGTLTDAAYGGQAELTRYQVVNGESRGTQLIEVDLAAVLRGDPAANILLRPFDDLSIKEVPQWGAQQVVTLLGQVRFPGHYAITRGETLKSVIQRAGGLTPYAFPEGSAFTRDELKHREQKEIDLLARRLQNDLVTLALQGAAANQAGAATSLTVGQSLLSQVRTTQAVGRLVIDLPRLIRLPVGSPADVILRNGDQLVVPQLQQEVTVIGEVQNSTSHLYRAGLLRDDYINMSGGVSRRADKGRIYVVRADGNVVSTEGHRWYSNQKVVIKPGDTIVVPLDTERLPALPLWEAVTQIIYNIAIAAAAVHTF